MLAVVARLRRAHATLRRFSSYASNGSQLEVLQAGELMPGVTTAEIASRRKKLMSVLPHGSLVILTAATVKHMTDVVPYPFRQSSHYLYFTGCRESGSIAVIYNAGDLCMFMPDPNPENAFWEGRLAHAPEAITNLKANRAYNMSDLPKILPRLLKQSKKIYVEEDFFPGSDLDNLPGGDLRKLPAYKEMLQEKKVESVHKHAYECRFVKSPSEVNLMRHAAKITSEAFIETIKVSRTRAHEHILAATMEFECRFRGAQRLAFPPVVAGGVNSTVIHYFRNDQKIREGEMILMAAGCEYFGYVSDVTRTWSPSGKISNPQKDVYNAVLSAYKDSLQMYKPGITLGEVQSVSNDKLVRATRGLGIVKKRDDYLKVNPTAVGRYLGLDTLDCKLIHEDRKLVPGVVCTIEPGLYIPLSDNFPKWFQGIGIRIADEVLITESGHEK
ncbi:hypothetical protein GOP47_0007063 [Adiantum capillus-veneris]|uniref:Aminopeptidase P N-terminal domain-containing protein n=1 Tax=Adiantum capillus-veneris TaxID=13818 RepID=A0A9D4V092_ADICA|nr:hypothetical protein GOP47_0007063 [Adiantum capillus-veneris]